LGIVLSITIGIVSGAELPIFSKVIEKEDWQTPKPIIAVLSSDYFGAFAGIMIFTFILNPFFGLIKTICMAQLFTLFIINAIYFSTNIFKRSRKEYVLFGILNLFVIVSFLLSDHFVYFIDFICDV